MAQTEKKKALKVKKWTVSLTEFTDGTSKMERTNDGFTPLELMGLSDFIKLEVRNQMLGIIKPDIIERKVINRKK